MVFDQIQFRPVYPNYERLFLSSDLVEDTLKVDGLGTLNRQTQCPVPDELCERSKTTANTESGSVVKSLLETVMVEEDTG